MWNVRVERGGGLSEEEEDRQAGCLQGEVGVNSEHWDGKEWEMSGFTVARKSGLSADWRLL